MLGAAAFRDSLPDMEERVMGGTGMRVSTTGLGTLTWGRDTDEHEAREQLEVFLDAGGTVVDTAATYGDGAAEELLGEFIRDVVARPELVIVTKAGVRQTPTGAVVDNSRGAVLNSLEASLERLGTDYVDLLLIQGPDPRTPVRETLGALEIAVQSGKARYVGLANHSGWQVAQAATLLEDTVGLAAVQVEHSLVNRTAEQEVFPAAVASGIGVMAWSPLGRGVLTGKYRRGTPADSRAASAHLAGFVQPYLSSGARAMVDALVTAADALGYRSAGGAVACALDLHLVAFASVVMRIAQLLRCSLGDEDVDFLDVIRDVRDERSQQDAHSFALRFVLS